MSDVRHVKVTINRAELARRLAKLAERKATMTEITVLIGSVQTGSSGTVTLDTTREVVFQAKELGSYSEPGTGRDGNPTDTRGRVETLYQADDGRFVVHVRDWSHWQGEPTTYTLHQVTGADLEPLGRFAELGRECGYGRPLTLTEALALDRGDDQEGTAFSPDFRAFLDREDAIAAQEDVEDRRLVQEAMEHGAVDCDDPESDD